MVKLISFFSSKMFFKKDQKTYMPFAKLKIVIYGMFKVEAHLYKDEYSSENSSNHTNGEHSLRDSENIEHLDLVNNKYEWIVHYGYKFVRFSIFRKEYSRIVSTQKRAIENKQSSKEENVDSQTSKKKQKRTTPSNVEQDEGISSTLFIDIEEDMTSDTPSEHPPTEYYSSTPFIQPQTEILENASQPSKLDLLKNSVQEWLSRLSNDQETNKGLLLMQETNNRKLVQSVIYRTLDSNVYQILAVIYEVAKVMNVNNDACLDKAFNYLESQFLCVTKELPQHEERKVQFCNLMKSKLPHVTEFESIIELIYGCLQFFSATQPISMSTFHQLQQYALELFPQESKDIISYFTRHVLPQMKMIGNHVSRGGDDQNSPYSEQNMSQPEMQKRIMDLLMNFKEQTMGQTFLKQYVNQIQALNLEDGLLELYQKTLLEFPHWEDEVKNAYETCLKILEERLWNQCFDSPRRYSFGFVTKLEHKKNLF
ncbi:hypothetical protein FDP41_008366 [Naegleria fowleri]|uniref:Uncharacterized protein n=1 Tax=Naegleria fowleri TaxID=5763 RepID=A0A6A5BJC1_NAEFO|nr:uncharacterized protein FDP41_008366 [Naegleria fowleri]KAF0973159.1 hypothetical protein FDP41_008366 [Naegleria fowleri]